MPSDPQVCVGCGRPGDMPFVAITQRGEKWVAQPVCRTCWSSPHTRVNPIKGHFFLKEHEQLALAHAGSSTIRG